MTGRVITIHQPPIFPPASFRLGEQVRIDKRDDEWTEFLWCIHADGRSAWIPEVYLTLDGDTGRLKTDYDSNELSTTIGEQLEILKSTGGWYWCRNGRGELGWVPVSKVLTES